MACYAIARTDQRLVIGNLQDVLDSPGLQNAIKEWLTGKLNYPVEMRTIVQGQNVRYYAGPHWLNIDRYEATLTGPDASVLKPEFEKFIKELQANIKVLQTVAAIKARAAILSDAVDAKSGNRVIEFQISR